MEEKERGLENATTPLQRTEGETARVAVHKQWGAQPLLHVEVSFVNKIKEDGLTKLDSPYRVQIDSLHNTNVTQKNRRDWTLRS